MVSASLRPNGESYDTSMGFTPLAGFAMGPEAEISTRHHPVCGGKENISVDEVMRILNHESGLLGVSGISNDVRVLLQRAKEGDERARLAIDVFVARLHQFIGLFFARLNGADAIIFTAGIGRTVRKLRKVVPRTRICRRLCSITRQTGKVMVNGSFPANIHRLKSWSFRRTKN